MKTKCPPEPSELKQVLALLPKLSAEDKLVAERWLKAAKSLLPRNERTKTDPKTDADVELALAAVVDALAAMGVEFPSAERLRRSKDFPTFAESVPGVIRYMRKGEVQSRNQQRGFLRMGVKLLYENMSEMRIPITARTVMQHFYRLPAVVNANFPGYAQGALLGWIVRAKPESDDDDDADSHGSYEDGTPWRAERPAEPPSRSKRARKMTGSERRQLDAAIAEQKNAGRRELAAARHDDPKKSARRELDAAIASERRRKSRDAKFAAHLRSLKQ